MARPTDRRRLRRERTVGDDDTLQLIDRGAHTMRYPDVLGHLGARTAPEAGA